MSDEKKPRVFIRNPDSGEPWVYIADEPDIISGKAATAVGQFVVAELTDPIRYREAAPKIELKIEMMTDAEVFALPEM